MPKPLYVTQPNLPPLEAFIPYLQDIWASKQLTNGGPMHQALEDALCDYLGVAHISLFNNGTVALMIALKALGLKGEVITTPYTFVATAHSLLWNNLRPVFVDVDPDTFNLDPAKIEAAITSETSAILPVHCYGIPCDTQAIQAIADRHDLKVIYDAAHAFGVRDERGSVLQHGDLSILSFHATKVFNTFEGGAIVCKDEKTKRLIDQLKNFGITDETTVSELGLNGKMAEINAAMGLLQLKHVDTALAERARIYARYQSAFAQSATLTLPSIPANLQWNHAYCPLLVGAGHPIKRDNLYEKLKAQGIHTRRYFYPLLSTFPMYQSMPSAQGHLLPAAQLLTEQVICLPIYPELQQAEQYRVIQAINDY